MVESITRIRQMMAEAKFIEAQAEAEMQMSLHDQSYRKTLLPIYLEILQAQHKKIPQELALEMAEQVIGQDFQEAQKWLELIADLQVSKNFRRIQLLRIQLAEKQGRLHELYQLIERYFKNDFHLKLQELANNLMLDDLSSSESILNQLIYSCVEKASPKGIKNKLSAIKEVLASHSHKRQLELYQSYCSLEVDGVQSKQDFKKIAELIIYFDQFKFQLLILALLIKLGLQEAAHDYVKVVKENKEYDYLYIEKYYGDLKSYFAKPLVKDSPPPPQLTSAPDLELEEPHYAHEVSSRESEYSKEEELLVNSLKYQNFGIGQLLELTVSFLQSEYNRAALKAAELAMEKAINDHQYLQACYLKLTCLCLLGDYRGALDLSFDALRKTSSKDDLLSFLYLQAESYQQLDQKKEAKKVLTRILSIDSHYRLTRERLEMLE